MSKIEELISARGSIWTFRALGSGLLGGGGLSTAEVFPEELIPNALALGITSVAVGVVFVVSASFIEAYIKGWKKTYEQNDEIKDALKQLAEIAKKTEREQSAKAASDDMEGKKTK